MGRTGFAKYANCEKQAVVDTEDLRRAVAEVNEWGVAFDDDPVDPEQLKLVGEKLMDPAEFMAGGPDSSDVLYGERGWLRERWGDDWWEDGFTVDSYEAETFRLQVASDLDHHVGRRTFEGDQESKSWQRIVDQYPNHNAAILIDGYPGDGWGRAQFCWAIGEELLVAVFVSEI